MKLFKEKKGCCGCTACKNACPKNAIAMVPDEEGFLYPKVDEDLCIQCHICEKVCPLQNPLIPEKGFSQRIFAAKHKDVNVVMSSSSGGVFTAISDYILSGGGVVYGAAFDPNFRVCHQRAETPEDRDRFKGSKYVQSDLGDIFLKIQRDLQNGKKVLFSGTPCQNAGLLSFLKQKKVNRDGLCCCDFVCHGTPSPLIWREYIDFLETQFQDKLVGFSFRDKSSGWKMTKIKATFESSSEEYNCNKYYSFLNIYSTLFAVRPVCFCCNFANYDRVTDITIADFWNIQNSHPELDDDKGTSTVFLNTPKGDKVFLGIKNELIYLESTPKDCWQQHLEYPCVEPKGRAKFWDEYRSKGSAYVIQKYGRGTFSSRMKKRVTPILRKLGLYMLAGKIYAFLFARRPNAGKAESWNEKH